MSKMGVNFGIVELMDICLFFCIDAILL